MTYLFNTNKINSNDKNKIYLPGELNNLLFSKNKSTVSNFGIIKLQGDIKYCRPFKENSGMSFKLQENDNDNSFSCKVWKNDIPLDIVFNLENTNCTITGKLEASFYNSIHSYYIQVLNIEKLMNETKLDSIKKQCEKNDYFKNKKIIAWNNINNIGIISKKNTQGYNDFVKQFDLPITIELKEISLEGKKTSEDAINAIKNFQNMDLILIIRGGGDTNEISNSFDTLELFDCIKKSKIPVITAIGHQDDKDDKLLITKVSDLDYATPTTAATSITEELMSTSINKIKQQCKTNEYFNNNKIIDWKNINNIGIISKKKSNGYNEFIEKFYIPIKIKLTEISLDGNNTYKEIIEAIKNFQNMDLILIINFPSLKNQIINSTNLIELFDYIKKSNKPVITAFDDENNKILITKVSDIDYITPSKASISINEKIIEHVEYKLNEYLENIYNSFETKFNNNKKKIFNNLNSLFETFFKKKFGGPILSIDEDDNFVIIQKNNKFYKNIIDFKQEISLTVGEIKYRIEILKGLDNNDIQVIYKNFKKFKLENNNLKLDITNNIEQMIDLEKIKYNFDNSAATKIKKLYCIKKKLPDLNKINEENLIDIKKIILYYISIFKNIQAEDKNIISNVFTYLKKIIL